MEETSQDSTDFHNLRILLIEDNEDDAELTFIAFKKHRIEDRVKWLKNSEDVISLLLDDSLQKYYHESIQLILLDLNLPKISGLQLLKKLKSDPRTKLIPIVVLTSSREENDIIACYKLGVNSYITKPIDLKEFTHSMLTIIRYWLSLNQQPQDTIRK